jgi:hypothetical protein
MHDLIVEALKDLNLRCKTSFKVGETVRYQGFDKLTPVNIKTYYNHLGSEYENSFDITIFNKTVDKSLFNHIKKWETRVHNEAVLRARVLNTSFEINRALDDESGVKVGFKIMYDLSNDIKILSVTNTRMTIGLPPDLASKFVTTPYATNTKSDFKKSNWLAMYKDILLSCSHPLDFWYFSRGVLDFLATRKTVPKLLKGVGRPFGKIKNGIAHLITDDFMAVLEVKTIRGVGDQLPSGLLKEIDVLNYLCHL